MENATWDMSQVALMERGGIPLRGCHVPISLFLYFPEPLSSDFHRTTWRI